VPVGSYKHSVNGIDLTEEREFPHTVVNGVDQTNPTLPRSDVESAAVTEI